MLNVQVVDVNGSSTTGQGDQAVDVVDYLGDTRGLGYYTSQNATDIKQILLSSLTNAGFGAFPLVDPTIIGDIANLGYLVSQDATYIKQFILGSTSTPIPATTGTPSSTASGPDPKVFVSKELAGLPGNSLDVPVQLLQTNDAPIDLQSFNLVISYDPSAFSVSGFQSGDLTTGFQLTEQVDAAQGLIFISGSSDKSLSLSPGTLGDLVQIDFTILSTAKSGSFEFNLLGNSGTSITSLNNGGLTLVPAPTNAGNHPIDGAVTVGDPWFLSPFRPGQSPVVFTGLTDTKSSLGESIEIVGAGPLLPAIIDPVATSTSSSSPSSSSPVLSSGSPSVSSPGSFSHDFAIESLMQTTDPEIRSPSDLIPLSLSGSTDDLSESTTLSRSAKRSARGLDSGVVRVALRHRPLARVIATTDTSQ